MSRFIVAALRGVACHGTDDRLDVDLSYGVVKCLNAAEDIIIGVYGLHIVGYGIHQLGLILNE